MSTRYPSSRTFFISQANLFRALVLILFAATVIIQFSVSSSASLLLRPTSSLRTTSASAPDANGPASSATTAGQELFKSLSSSGSGVVAPFAFMPQAPSLATFEATCTTPQSTFDLGDTVCLKITNEPLGDPGRPARRIAWASPYGSVAQSGAITTDPQTSFYTIPSTATQDFISEGGAVATADNRGTWRIHSIATEDGSSRNTVSFTVKDPDQEFVDLSVQQYVTTPGSEVGSGDGSIFEIFVSNSGPSNAATVTLTDTLSDNATFTSIVESPGGPGFDCVADGNVVVCTVASMPANSTAHLTLAYEVNSGTPAGAQVTNTVSIASSPTPCSPALSCEIQPNDNASSASATVPAEPVGQTCTLDCRENMSVVANATQAGNPGAFVSFGFGSQTGNCGIITVTPSSGSFFPVGATVVEVSSEIGGGSCTFTVTVVEGTPPTITCPPDQTVTAASGETSANVAVGTPTTNPSSGVTVVGKRSDDDVCDEPGCTVVPLTDPYPLGTTTINWTVTDANGLSSSCVQRITVNENNCGGDTTDPVITAPANVTIGTGPGATSCGVGLDDELGLPTATDDCSFSISTTGIPPGNFFPVGTTTITYTATDGAGNSASATQTVTVFDNTPPKIKAPADATYTCLSDVPAASPSQATRGDVFDENGVLLPPGPPFDNCGAPVVTVTQSSTGAGTTASPRIITRTFTATDTSPLQNSASDVQTITVIDPTPPTISCPANIVVQLPLNSTAVSMPVSFSVSGNDNCSGVGVVSTPASGSVFPLGTTTVNSTATDAVGNTASCSFTVTVLYNFTGFFSPINNLPALNSVNAGKNIPVKFSLSGNKGLNIMAPGNPYSVSFNCATNDPGVDITETNSPGNSSLSYSPDTYHYNWKTEKAWEGTCRTLVITLNDGSVHTANFKFK